MRNFIRMMLSFLLCFTLTGLNAQITVFTDVDTNPGSPCDEGRIKVAYTMSFVKDTTQTDVHPLEESMMLEIGKRISLFYSYTDFVMDSVFNADRRNGVSQAIMNEHLQQFGSGNISWKLYKNYLGKGSTTLLDKMGMARYRCEEKGQLPHWTLESDTLSIIGFTCRKATSYYKGRSWTAWYSPDIPIGEGPWKLCGLPGLILKAEDNQHYFRFEANGIKKMDASHSILYKGDKYESISRKDLDKLYKRYYADPVGFITSNPNITVNFTDENGNKMANPKAVPYNPLER